MSKFKLPWDEEPISTIMSMFNCTVQYIENREDDSDGVASVEDQEE